ncbi:Hypothetical predicted protein [Marmota monax]|uniref:Uncharacterized protein n=1 Tax=Marmota monax TaxID=9995 RepID=A0A5E4CM51_MARMO|nr:Hypothetical predicted protein [Marmota monax]
MRTAPPAAALSGRSPVALWTHTHPPTPSTRALALRPCGASHRPSRPSMAAALACHTCCLYGVMMSNQIAKNYGYSGEGEPNLVGVIHHELQFVEEGLWEMAFPMNVGRCSLKRSTIS